MVNSRDVDRSDVNKALDYTRAGASDAIKDRARGTAREHVMRVCRAFITSEPEVLPISLLKEGEIGDAVGARQSSRCRRFDGVEGKVTVTDETPGVGRGGVGEWGYHVGCGPPGSQGAYAAMIRRMKPRAEAVGMATSSMTAQPARPSGVGTRSQCRSCRTAAMTPHFDDREGEEHGKALDSKCIVTRYKNT
jgi:hypothetical protein